MTQVAQDWPVVMLLVHIALATGVTVHAVLRKRETATVIGWVGLAWLAPMIGSLAYTGFAINRIQRKAIAASLSAAWRTQRTEEPIPAEIHLHDGDLAQRHPTSIGLATLGKRITGNPLLLGNRVELLENGDEAFPAMIAAIDGARHSVTLVTYLFDHDRAGSAFHAALVQAKERGVAVRVLIDDVGSHYTRPTMVRQLRRAGVPVAAFLPARTARWLRYANLRNHRKILVIDGVVGFAGGLNIREGHWLGMRPAAPVSGLHFRIDGPVVTDLQRTFAMDWAFATGEHLVGEPWFALIAPQGVVAARGIASGPDEDLNHTADVLLGAVSQATRHLLIVTPYFLPDEVLLRALEVASLRGVQVDIVLPSKTNVVILDWANVPHLADLLAAGCRVHLTPPPFDHTKLVVLDGFWSLIGSGNWDTRSLRLNFEYDIECYDEALARRLQAHTDAKIAHARLLTLDEVRLRPFGVRLRNGLARLLSPYL